MNLIPYYEEILKLSQQLLGLVLKQKNNMPAPVISPIDKRLIDAIVQVESGGVLNAIGDKHLAKKAYGPMQIRQPAVDDVNRVFKTNHKAQDMLGNLALSSWVFEAYMSIYANSRMIGREVTNEDRARIWNSGPTGWKKANHYKTNGYWAKVKKHLE